MSERNQFSLGLQSYAVFKRYLESEAGKMRNTQHVLLLSYGVYDWFSIDLKGGAGNIKQHPQDSNEIDYRSNLAGGYGFRLKIHEGGKIKAVFGFQHISVHPKSTHIGDDKHQAVLDDWQVSLLGSYDFDKLTPYLGLKYSRADYIHWNVGNRERTMSDLTKTLGVIVGTDVSFNDKIWLNLEAQAQDSEAFAVSINYKF